MLTQRNEKTYASNNAGWNSDDPKNVDYVQCAIARLGSRAYGQTFGALMDNEKEYEKPPNSNIVALLTGMTATLDYTVDCFDSREALNAEETDLEHHDSAGAYQNATAHSGTLRKGTDITIIDSHPLGDVEIRAQSGSEAGTACWTTETYLKPRLINITNP